MGKLASVCTLLVSAAAGLFAQQTQLGGTVSDPTGAVIPAAAITIVSNDNGAQRATGAQSLAERARKASQAPTKSAPTRDGVN